jgi:hypothetical protein
MQVQRAVDGLARSGISQERDNREVRPGTSDNIIVVLMRPRWSAFTERIRAREVGSGVARPVIQRTHLSVQVGVLSVSKDTFAKNLATAHHRGPRSIPVEIWPHASAAVSPE